ncbi:FAD:protein FMN transferase [Flavobacterium soyangense]|uniref:FAD:protein FMN transferase n=1 Tax=Flavobacterium soyangense TaxID=2023265 RepID=A0A930XY75_9FLAO|nr:FAD:protein FMN transferase [Flavobacterium soyangense]MBF2707538.1 FAD:protein FMN transferase [Flavobacterium soyangense]
MKKIGGLLSLYFFYSVSIYSQQEPIKIEGEAQGTTYHITYFDNQNRDYQPEIVKILKDFDLSVSTYIPNSIISRINSNEKNVIVDKYFMACFNKAKEVWKNTNGAFDPTIYPLSNAYGFGPGKKQKIEKVKIDSMLQFVGFQLIKLKGNKVVKKDPRVALDFNAFAQGYSVDVVSDFLNSKGILAYIVEIGGEVYAKGRNSNGENWKIGIEKPIENKETGNSLKAIVKLENLAIATSGNYRRFIIEDGVKYVHHIDPKTGYPTKNNLLSASIFAKECITSDANATGVLVLGLEKAKVFLKKHPELQAYLIYSDENGNYQVYETPSLKSIITETK